MYGYNNGFIQPPVFQPIPTDFRKETETLENNIGLGRRRFKVCKEYLGFLDHLSEKCNDYREELEDITNTCTKAALVEFLNSTIVEACEDLNQEEIAFDEFIEICGGFNSNESSVVNAIHWIQKHRKSGRKNFESILRNVIAFFTMILCREDADSNLIRRLTNVTFRLIEFLGGRNNEYKDVLLKMKGDFSVFFCLMKTHDDEEGSLVMKWDTSIQKGLFKLDKVFKELASTHEKEMKMYYDGYAKELRSRSEFNRNLGIPLPLISDEVSKVLDKDKVNEFEVYLKECEALDITIRNWIVKGVSGIQSNTQNLANISLNNSFENFNTPDKKAKEDNRNWFQKQFCPSYSSLFMANDNNVQFQPIDPSQFGTFGHVNEVSDDVKDLFQGYRAFLSGNINDIQSINKNGYETFNKFMKLKSRLREEAKEITYEENKAYSEYFINDFNEIEHEESIEVDKNSNGEVETHNFLKQLSNNSRIL